MIKFIIVTDTHGEDLSKLYTAIDNEIKKDKKANLDIKHFLVVPGDIFSVNKLLSVNSKGEFDIEVLSKLASLFDADARLFLPGNHDYTHGESQLIKLIQDAGFQVVISNTEFNTNSALPFKKSIFLQNGNETIQIGGLMTPETLNNNNAKNVITAIDADYKFEEPSPDVIISHLGFKDDKRRQDTGHILGGHSHDLEVDYFDKPSSKIGPNTSDNKRYIVNAGAFGENLVTVSMAPNKKITGTSIIPTKDFTANPEIGNITKKYQQKLEQELELPEGTLAKNVCQFTPDIQPSGLDLLPDKIKVTENHLRIVDTIITRTAADALANKYGHITLFPAAGIRGNFEASQSLTYTNVLEAFAAGNKIVKLEITGKELIEGLAKSILQSHRYWRGRGRLLHPSQKLSYKYDINNNPGDVIQQVNIDSQPINPDKKYTIITTDWAASYAFPKDKIEFVEIKDNYITAKTVADYIEGKTLTESFSERISCGQSLQYQEELLGNLDRAKSEVKNVESFNIEHHRNRYALSQNKKQPYIIPPDSPILTTPKPDFKPIPVNISPTANLDTENNTPAPM